VRVMMITGDHQGTARGVAEEVGILPRGLAPKGEEVVSCREVSHRAMAGDQMFRWRLGQHHRRRLRDDFMTLSAASRSSDAPLSLLRTFDRLQTRFPHRIQVS
jgi:magnesium-transporting ATPase (P-type)